MALPRPRVFIAHSSNCPPEDACGCRAFLTATELYLGTLGCVPVYDKAYLAGGCEWSPELMRLMGSCHGMVVLVSPHALGSRHVRNETRIAEFMRANSEGSFVLLPVLLPGVRRPDLDGNGSELKELGLSKYDLVYWTADAGPGKPPEKLAKSLLPLVERRGSLPHPEVTEYVACRIAGLSDAVLERTAEILGVTTLAYARHHTSQRVSRGLLTERPLAEFGDPCLMREALGYFLGRLADRSHRQEIVDLVVPYARVPRGAADQLQALSKAARGRVALLESRSGHTAEMYLRRASESPDPWLVHRPVPRTGMPWVESIVGDIRDFLHRELCFGEPCGPAELHKVLVRHERESGGPVTVALHEPAEARLLQRLPEEFPRLLFLFSSAQVTDAPPALGSRNRLISLTPGQERDMLATHRRFHGAHAPYGPV
ncbi:toll/interleukin-1 receptor domain-containing protein [Streptomyces triculaminicus]|uniref:Toll/interleukin-1 receptor domain-containing protein n=2 Tax=Streptomyces TaxID=1883 RepID=A0A939FPJ2_9ACTN|nr:MULTISPECIES: toll/interleukin-1 receptor domain-containing protein [Streptomyces]MBO0655790.1 toll/interleukin-1 receptor domain-containing protein [Streptomyces triculaminicus]QSY49811.1 toll/interleukin-1 receptor domain-containing protein [Streptomyces griseocarneus]